jgi:hypothetical protein
MRVMRLGINKLLIFIYRQSQICWNTPLFSQLRSNCMRIPLTLALLVFLVSCQKQGQAGPSVLLIAIEGLSSANFTCNSFEDSERSGFQILCAEAVRFTHAFTPSPMAQAGLGAILTGTPPRINGLRDNGRTFLAAKTITLTEKLIEQSVHTFFVASAPTIKRYSRLHQGFENFNDEYDLSYRNFYRPIGESFSIFKTWLHAEVRSEKFFAILHVSDLLFPQVITQTELLEPRPRGLEGQMEEVDENLYLLFTSLKQKGLWDKTYIAFVGLNGTTSNSRFNELPGTNLFAENVSVPLFFKPLKGREEIPHQWKVDVHVTLQDLGVTLEEIFKVSAGNRYAGRFAGKSLLPLINGKSSPAFNDRPIMIESAWGEWAAGLVPRFSIRNDQWLLVYDKHPLLYNALTDRNEINRVPLKDSSYSSTIEKLASLFEDPLPKQYEKPDISLNEEFRLTQILVDNEGRSIDTFLNELLPFIEGNPTSNIIRWLTLDQLLRQKKWDLIEELNQIWQDPLIQQVLAIKDEKLNSAVAEPCIDLLKTESIHWQATAKRQCHNNDFLMLADLLLATVDKKEALLDRYSIIFRYQALQLKLIYIDLSKGGIVFGANTKRLRELMMFRLALSLPRFQKEASLLEKRLAI